MVNLPDWAEAKFATYCADADMTANKSTYDRFGWDYIVEFAYTKNASLSHDLQPGSATARVQVKSKIGGKPSIMLKLSNALHFVKESDPCFLLLIWRSKDGVDTRTYTKIFGPELMEKALKRAREADRDDEKKLNKITLSIPMDEEDETGDNTGEWLRNAITALPKNYGAEKAKLTKTLGYEADSIRGMIKFEHRKLPDFIDQVIGLKGGFEAADVTVSRHRFDIPDRKPIVTGKPDKLEIIANPDPAILTITEQDGRSVSFNGDHRSFSFPGMPLEELKSSFINQFITATLYGTGKFHISYKFNGADILPLGELRKTVAFYLICKGEIGIKLEVIGKPAIETQGFHLKSDADEWHDWFDTVLQSLGEIDLGDRSLVLSLDQLGPQSEHVEHFVQNLQESSISVTSNLFRNTPVPFPTIKNLLGFLILPLGDKFLGVIVRRSCLDVQVGADEFSCEFGDPVTLDARFVENNERNIASFSNTFRKLREKMGKGTVILNDGNLGINDTKDLHVSQ